MRALRAVQGRRVMLGRRRRRGGGASAPFFVSFFPALGDSEPIVINDSIRTAYASLGFAEYTRANRLRQPLLRVVENDLLSTDAMDVSPWAALSAGTCTPVTDEDGQPAFDILATSTTDGWNQSVNHALEPNGGKLKAFCWSQRRITGTGVWSQVYGGSQSIITLPAPSATWERVVTYPIARGVGITQWDGVDTSQWYGMRLDTSGDKVRVRQPHVFDITRFVTEQVARLLLDGGNKIDTDDTNWTLSNATIPTLNTEFTLAQGFALTVTSGGTAAYVDIPTIGVTSGQILYVAANIHAVTLNGGASVSLKLSDDTYTTDIWGGATATGQRYHLIKAVTDNPTLRFAISAAASTLDEAEIEGLVVVPVELPAPPDYVVRLATDGFAYLPTTNGNSKQAGVFLGAVVTAGDGIALHPTEEKTIGSASRAIPDYKPAFAVVARNTAYTLSQRILPVDLYLGVYLECTGAGTSHATDEPDLTGLIVGDTVADGTVQWTLRHYKGLGVQMSPARTNSIPYSWNYANAGWTKSNLTPYMSAIGIGGIPGRGAVLVDDDVVNPGYMEKTAITVANDANSNGGIAIIPKTANNSGLSMHIALTYSGGTGFTADCYFDPYSGALNVGTMGFADVIELPFFNIVRFSKPNTAAGNTAMAIRIYPCHSDDGGATTDDTLTGYAALAHVQVQLQKVVPSFSPIITNGATATTVTEASLLDYTKTSFFSQTKGTILLDIVMPSATWYTPSGDMFITLGGSSKFLLYGSSGSDFRFYDGTSYVTHTHVEVPNQITRVGLSWEGISKRISINGETVVEGTYDGAFLESGALMNLLEVIYSEYTVYQFVVLKEALDSASLQTATGVDP